MSNAKILHRPWDDSYVIDRNGLPYHVPKEGEWADLWAEVHAYALEHPDEVSEEQPWTPPAPTPEEARAAALAHIDAETSAAILAGFDYEVDGVSYHFSYDSFDQQNFADTANACILAQSGVEGLPGSVTWNAYADWTAGTGGSLVRLSFTAAGFLALYTAGALAHKAARMEEGGRRKAALDEVRAADEGAAA